MPAALRRCRHWPPAAVLAAVALACAAGAAVAASDPPGAATAQPAPVPAAPAAAPAAPAERPSAHPAARLIERAAIELRDDPETSRRDTETALELLAKRPDADLEVRARLLLCDYYSERDPAAARAQVDAGRARLADARRRGLEAGLLTCEGEILQAAGDNAGARTAFDDAVRRGGETADREMLASALFSRGYLLGVQGEYAAGLADLKRAQQYYDDLQMPVHSLTALNSIAILYNRMADYAEAKHIYERALEAQRRAGMRRELGVTFHNLGRAHERLREWPQARDAYDRALAAHREIRYGRGEAYALRGLAAVANADGHPGRALELLLRAADLERASPDARLLAQIDLARGTALKLSGRYGEAAEALGRAEAVFVRADALPELVDVYGELAAVRAALGDWRAAYEAQSRDTEVTERLLRNQLDQRFAALKVEFDTAAKEKENLLLLRENAATLRELAQQERARRLQWAVLALTVTLAAVLATLALRQWRGTRRMHTLAMTDELTGMPNRRAVLKRLENLLALRDGTRCAVLLLDVDHFKNINDQHGHPAGDEVLRILADGLRDVIREPAFFGRLGGEEFLIVLPDTALEAAVATAERLRSAVLQVDASRWYVDGRRITASLGVTVQERAEDTTSALLKRADGALYEAKRTGRNRVVAAGADPRPRAA
jgi:diguanylate cyclase (GGDEF)-like protein